MNRRIAIAESTLRDVQSEFMETEQRIAAKKSAKEQEAMDVDISKPEPVQAPMEATVSAWWWGRGKRCSFYAYMNLYYTERR